MIWNPLFSPVTAWPWRDLAQTDLRPGPARFPAIRAHLKDDAVTIEALLPGVGREALELSVDEDQLVLEGELPAPQGEARPVRRERSGGRFRRRLQLPFPVDTTQARARLEHGVLRLELARDAKAGPRRIAIHTQEGDDHAS